MPMPPILHHGNKRIRMYALSCVLGLLFHQWTSRWVRVTMDVRLAINALEAPLDRIGSGSETRRSRVRTK